MSNPENAARARAALAAKRAQEAQPKPEAGTDAFAIMRTADGMYIPALIRIPAGTEVAVTQLHEPMPYEALAYHYLANDVTAHYEAGTRSKARECAAMDSDSRNSGPVGHG